MQDFLELCGRRQSCRKFADKPVEKETLLRCVEAARLAPSACNSQPWSFVVVQQPDVLAQVAQATQQMGINDYTSAAEALVLVVEEHARLMPKLRCILDSQYFARHDLGAATLMLTLAAEDQGLGSCILGIFDREKINQAVGLPPEKNIVAVVALGYPEEDRVREKKRKPMEEIVRFV